MGNKYGLDCYTSALRPYWACCFAPFPCSDFNSITVTWSMPTHILHFWGGFMWG